MINQSITPLAMIPIEQLSSKERAEIEILSFVSSRSEFFSPWGEEQFWKDFCTVFPYLEENVTSMKKLFSVGYLEDNFDNVAQVKKRVISGDRLAVGLIINKNFSQLPLDVKKKVAFHEILHFMRLSGCKVESDSMSPIFYTKIGHNVEKYDSNYEKIDGFGEGLEEAYVESMALNAIQIHNNKHDYVSQKHPYASLAYAFNIIINSGLLNLFEEISNTPIKNSVTFYDRIFDCLYNEPTNEFDYNYNNICDAFDNQYFQTMYGYLRGVSLDEMINNGNDSFNSLKFSVIDFTRNITNNVSWLNIDVTGKCK